MASFVKFEIFLEDLCKKVHNLHSDTLNVYLSNDAPVVATDVVKTDVTEISTGSGYIGPVDTQNTVSRSGGTVSVVGTDIVITASGAVGPFRYVPLYNDTPTSPLDPLIGYWDYGSAITLASAETFTVDFGASMMTFA
jgi:hypothetical protein